MPLQNRVDPFGNLHAVSSRGSLMGNRGILHDDDINVLRKHAHQNWVTCALEFKGRTRTLMQPNRYTELFFLDEATAFAAGHRPCAECRRARYNEFMTAWRSVHGEIEPGRSRPQTVDRMLHQHRIARGGKKVTFAAHTSELPDGTIFEFEGQPILVWKAKQFDWTFDSYRERNDAVNGQVNVLTPLPIVEVFRTGFIPQTSLPASG